MARYLLITFLIQLQNIAEQLPLLYLGEFLYGISNNMLHIL